MIKYYDVATTFSEFPDEIALCINITNCCNNCPFCSEPWLKENIGNELTEAEIDSLISKHPGITLIGFMGGDSSHSDIVKLTEYIHSKGLKVGMYSGLDSLDMNLLNCLDYYKFGRWIKPEGEVENWWKKNCGPLKFTFSNQVMLKKVGDNWINITDRFRDKPLNNLKKEII